MGQTLTTARFYMHGRKNFTVKCWDAAQPDYKEGFLEAIDLAGRVFMVTGANSGIGKEVTRFLASRGGTVYMICRSKERAEAAKEDIVKETGSELLNVILGDVSRRADVLKIIDDFKQKETKLDALICNGGTITDDKTLTNEGVEVTFACHLLYGTYLLAKEALPLLAAADQGRVVMVSSGGMYNTKFPTLEVATATGLSDKKYNGQLAYAYAKRGQVLLAEEWTKSPPTPNVKFVSCHPGWVRTPGVAAVYGSKSKWLEPMRDMWQGSEGICWLAVVNHDEMESGAFYLDRHPQNKHLSGCSTQNKPEEIEDMMKRLEEWSTTPPGLP